MAFLLLVLTVLVYVLIGVGVDWYYIRSDYIGGFGEGNVGSVGLCWGKEEGAW